MGNAYNHGCRRSLRTAQEVGVFDVTMAHAAAAATVATDAGLGGLVLEKAGQYVLIIAFFGSIIWFLRFLYGPKGIFRDPAWDRWNEDARREDASRAKAGDGPDCSDGGAGAATGAAQPPVAASAISEGDRP